MSSPKNISPPKRQHYVPRTYLKKFAIKRKKNYNIFAADKKNLTTIIFPNIINVCVESDCYTLNGTGVDSQSLEKLYDNIENDYDEVYKVLTNSSIREISPEMHHKIILTVITMMYRTTKWLHSHNEVIDQLLEQMFDLCSRVGKDSFFMEKVEYSIKGKSLKEVQQNFRRESKDINVLLQLDVALRLADIRKKDGILVTRQHDDHKLFTSDNPVILSNLNPGVIAPFDPENIIRLPLDSQHLLTIIPQSHSIYSHNISRVPLSYEMSFLKMITNNSSQLNSCYKYILGSKKGLLEYLSKKEVYESPVSDVQQNNLSELQKVFYQTVNKLL